MGNAIGGNNKRKRVECINEKDLSTLSGKRHNLQESDNGCDRALLLSKLRENSSRELQAGKHAVATNSTSTGTTAITTGDHAVKMLINAMARKEAARIMQAKADKEYYYAMKTVDCALARKQIAHELKESVIREYSDAEKKVIEAKRLIEDIEQSSAQDSIGEENSTRTNQFFTAKAMNLAKAKDRYRNKVASSLTKRDWTQCKSLGLALRLPQCLDFAPCDSGFLVKHHHFRHANLNAPFRLRGTGSSDATASGNRSKQLASNGETALVLETGNGNSVLMPMLFKVARTNEVRDGSATMIVENKERAVAATTTAKMKISTMKRCKNIFKLDAKNDNVLIKISGYDGAKMLVSSSSHKSHLDALREANVVEDILPLEVIRIADKKRQTLSKEEQQKKSRDAPNEDL